MLIAQITDTHIVDKGKYWLNEPRTQTAERLSKTINYLNHLYPRPDIVLFTGDASDTGTPASYAHLKELLSPLKIPYFLIPGNHDDRENLRKVFSLPQEGPIQYVIDDYPVKLIGLDTLIPGSDAGRLTQESFDWLKSIHMDRPTLIFMHHPPAKVGYKLFDNIRCEVPIGFEEFINSQDLLLGILTGHFHHFCITTYGQKPCFIAPGVAPVHYIADPNIEKITALELSEPSISLHQWQNGDALISHIHTVKDFYDRIDWKTIHAGYKTS